MATISESDGAAAAVVMSADDDNKAAWIQPRPVTSPLPRWHKPEEMGLGPGLRHTQSAQLAGSARRTSLVRNLNEAFARNPSPSSEEAGLDPAHVTPTARHALGHPLAANRAKLPLLFYAKRQRRKARYGMVTMCVGGGMWAEGILRIVVITKARRDV